MSFFRSLFQRPTPVEPAYLQTVDDFEQQVLGASQPVLLNVSSPRCPPCRKLAPVLVGIATDHQERLRVVSVGSSSDRALLGRLGVRATPTTIIYEQGEEVGRVVGYRPRSWWEGMIREELS